MRSPFRRVRAFLSGLLAWPPIVLAILGGPNAVRADQDLSREMAEMAKSLKTLLGEKGQGAVAVGEFRGPARLVASGGPAIAKALADELKKLGVTVNRRAALEVNGEFRDVEETTNKMLALEIKAQVVNRNGERVGTLPARGIFNVTTIASLVGATVAMPADATPEARNEKLAQAVENPKVHLATTRISATPDSPYAIEILVKSGDDYRPRAATKDDGFAFLTLGRGELYAVKLVNDSPHDAAVTLTIDGLNDFAFSENKDYTHWIVPGKQSLTVLGWHRTNQLSDAFQVAEYAKSAAAERLPNSASLGTITASFAAAWLRGQPAPEDEASAQAGTRAGDATGKGPPVKTDFREVVRDVGRLRASVSVRYNKNVEPKDLPGGKP
jgi:hypothetical protein